MIRGFGNRRARWQRHALLLVLGSLTLAACSGTGADTTTGSPSASPAPALQAVIVSSVSSSGPCGGVACGVVGTNQRIGIFVTTPTGGVVSGATVIAQVFTVPTSTGSSAKPIGPAQQATYAGGGIESPDQNINRGVYAIYQTFSAPGQYHVAVKATKGPDTATSDVSYLILGADPGIAVGAPAPKSHNQVAADVTDIGTIDTGTPADDMHYITIAAAIAAHHVSAIYMGTPAFCQSRTCAPELNAVKSVEAKYHAMGADFIHIEVYKGGRPDNPDFTKATLSPTFTEWKLDTEPWVMLVDKSGNLAYKFSGATGGEEISAALDKLLA